MKKITAGLGVLAIVLGVTAVSAGSALAYRGDPATPGANYSAERHTAMMAAFEQGDYTAWKNLMQAQGRVAPNISEADFAKLVEAHNLALQGKTAEAAQIRQELGLGFRGGSGWHRGMMRGAGMGMGMGRGFTR